MQRTYRADTPHVQRTTHTTYPNAPIMSDPHTPPPEPSAPPAATTRSDRRVQEGSEESFPASDPPSYMGARAPASGVDTPTGTVDQPADISFARHWAMRLVRALDHEQVDDIMAMLADDAIVRVDGGPGLAGHGAIREWLTGWFARQGPCSRGLTDVRQIDDALFIELEMTCEGAHGQWQSWPEAISVRLRRDVASRLTVYGAR